MDKELKKTGTRAVKYCLMHHLFTPKELEELKNDPQKLAAVSQTKMDLHLATNNPK